MKRLTCMLLALALMAVSGTAFGEAGEGAVVYTASDGLEITLTPSNRAAFRAQDKWTGVHTLVGQTYGTGSIIQRGTDMSLLDAENTIQWQMPVIVFAWQAQAEGETLYAAIEELARKTTLDYDGSQYRVMLAWVTEEYVSFFFMCEPPQEEIPVFTLQEEGMVISFGK